MQLFEFFANLVGCRRASVEAQVKVIQLHEMPRPAVSSEDSVAVAQLVDRVSKQSARPEREVVTN